MMKKYTYYFLNKLKQSDFLHYNLIISRDFLSLKKKIENLTKVEKRKYDSYLYLKEYIIKNIRKIFKNNIIDDIHHNALIEKVDDFLPYIIRYYKYTNKRNFIMFSQMCIFFELLSAIKFEKNIEKDTKVAGETIEKDIKTIKEVKEIEVDNNNISYYDLNKLKEENSIIYHIHEAKKFVKWLRYNTIKAKDKTKRIFKYEKSYDFLLDKVNKNIEFLCSKYFLPGNERDDIKQDAAFLLLGIIEDFDINKNITFESFAQMCMWRKLVSKIHSISKTKNKIEPLNFAKSFDEPIINDEDSTFLDYYNDGVDLFSDLANEEDINFLKRKAKENLTDLEYSVFDLYVQNYKYNEISDLLGIKQKAVDNALARIKKKLKSLYDDGILKI